jgi:hypothetical protein
VRFSTAMIATRHFGPPSCIARKPKRTSNMGLPNGGAGAPFDVMLMMPDNVTSREINLIPERSWNLKLHVSSCHDRMGVEQPAVTGFPQDSI